MDSRKYSRNTKTGLYQQPCDGRGRSDGQPRVRDQHHDVTRVAAVRRSTAHLRQAFPIACKSSRRPQLISHTGSQKTRLQLQRFQGRKAGFRTLKTNTLLFHILICYCRSSRRCDCIDMKVAVLSEAFFALPRHDFQGGLAHINPCGEEGCQSRRRSKASDVMLRQKTI